MNILPRKENNSYAYTFILKGILTLLLKIGKDLTPSIGIRHILHYIIVHEAYLSIWFVIN
jgi:hypothetical protein